MEELSIEELLGFQEESKEKEDLFSEFEDVNSISDDFTLEEHKENTNDLWDAFSEDALSEIVKEMTHPTKAVIQKVTLEETEPLGNIDSFLEEAKRKRNSHNE